MQFRRATTEDLELTFNWANDPDVRLNSYSSDPIVFDNHKSWFYNKIQDSNSIYFIAEESNESIGQLRFEKVEDHVVIGVTIAPEQRGKGYGSGILREGLIEYSKIWNLPVYAYIKVDNMASIKAFERAGFEFKEHLEYLGHPSKLYIWK